MIPFLIICVLTSLFAAAYAKNWFGAGKLTEIERVIIRLILATAGFLSLHLSEILHKESSFFESMFTFIGAYCGVISSYVVIEKVLLKKKPVFADDVSFLGSVLYHNVGANACRWLYVGEVIFYLLIVLL